MRTKLMKILVILISIIFTESLFSQNYDPYNGFHCEENLGDYLISGNSPTTTGGAYKPERTNNYTGTGSSSVFRILIIFVEYSNNSIDIGNANWPAGSAPTYMNELLASSRNNSYGSTWWDAYSESNEKLSDYWMEESRGNFHVVGETHHIVLENPWYWYLSHGNLEAVNTEIYDSLNLILGERWSEFDKWTFLDGAFKYEPDRRIDMMYIVHRTWRSMGDLTPGSIASLYNSNQGGKHVTTTGDTIVAGFGHEGSGCTFTPGAPGGYISSPFSGDLFLPLEGHELGHYHFGICHASYGIMAGGDCYYFTGLDSRHSPWETIKLGYGVPLIQSTSQTNYGLYDFSSRNNSDTMQVIQVPVSGDYEFFLIASRIKLSAYDRIMAGDTAHDNPFREINTDFAKGVYIYHTPSGYNWIPQMDQECADGLFNWVQDGTRHPDWSNSQNISYYVKTSVSYNNDPSDGNLSNNDDKSIMNWFGIGKKHVSLGDDGTDRIYTNDEDVWTSRAWKGDRYDAWKVGYNEIFSPYSSPSTKKWDNSNSGIFIWNYQSSGSGPANLAYLKIYKTGLGEPISLDSVLHLTPPSRPMGLKVVSPELFPEINNYTRLKITWSHNMEPDMKRATGSDTLKRYQIYRSVSENMSIPPPDALSYSESLYDYLTTVDINEDSAAMFIDSALISYYNVAECGMSACWELYPVRYRVQAVDKYDDVSVLSDFAQTSA